MKNLKEKNEAIAIFAGFHKTNIGWFDNEEIFKFNSINNTFNELLFDSDWNWLMSFIDYVEQKFGFSLVIYPNECYWIDNNGDYIFDETFNGERTDAVFEACFSLVSFKND
jgi:hypothetical protein